MTSATKQELSRRVDVITGSWEWLPPVLGDDTEVTGSRVVQLDATGAATVELTLAGRAPVFAKLFPDDSGQRVYDTLLALRDGGLGEGSRYQAVRPLAFLRAHGLLLTEAAPGIAVSEGGGGDLMAGAVEGARWLARLHSLPVRRNDPWSFLVTSETLSLARRLCKVMARRPELVDLAVGMIGDLEDLADRTIDAPPVQSHGQYRPIHVFVAPQVTTVIDLDRSRPSDPARDVAEFVHRLRMTTYWEHGSVATAEEATGAFLAVYRADVNGPATELTNLSFHWARYITHSLNRHLKKDDDDLAATIAFYRSEFDRVRSGELLGA